MANPTESTRTESMKIESTKNETVKRAKSLAMHKARLALGLHFIEGENLVTEALLSNMKIEDAFLEAGHEETEVRLLSHGARVYTVTRTVMESLTDTKTPQWVAATVKTPEQPLPAEFEAGLYVALDAVQDPGNLGTILRTADAMGAKGLFLSPGCADPYAPKTLRAAMGSTYHLPVYRTEELSTALQALKSQGFTAVCGHLRGSETLPKAHEKCVLVIGNEGHGVGDDVAEVCEKYRLPMYGRAESLNASVAAGILIYELARTMREGR